MPCERLTIRTSDGECPTYLFTPAGGDGPWPAVVVYMDAGGVMLGESFAGVGLGAD